MTGSWLDDSEVIKDGCGVNLLVNKLQMVIKV